MKKSKRSTSRAEELERMTTSDGHIRDKTALDSACNADTDDDARWSMELQAEIDLNRNPNHSIRLQVVTPSEREQYRIPVYTPVIL